MTDEDRLALEHQQGYEQGYDDGYADASQVMQGIADDFHDQLRQILWRHHEDLLAIGMIGDTRQRHTQRDERTHATLAELRRVIGE